MKEWSKAFYNSGKWRKCRKEFIKSKHGLCERCGEPAKIAHHKKYLGPNNINNPNITFNWDNLESVCKDCHDDEHKWNKKEVVACNEGLMFDYEGNLVRP